MKELFDILKQVREFGGDVVAFAFIAFVSWKLLGWGKSIVDTVMAQAKEEREAWKMAIESMTKTIYDMTDVFKNHHADAIELRRQNAEAHSYQREEHKELCKLCSEVASSLKSSTTIMSIASETRAQEHKSMMQSITNMEKNCDILHRSGK